MIKKKLYKTMKGYTKFCVFLLLLFVYSHTIIKTGVMGSDEYIADDYNADKYFYEKIKTSKEWDNILLTDDAAPKEMIDEYTLDGTKPYIKYNYSSNDDTLYIHTYFKFDSISKERFRIYKTSLSGKYVFKEATNKSYQNVIMDGFEEYWSFMVTGDEYDFQPGCNFETKVIIHTDGTSEQEYIHVEMNENDKDSIAYVLASCMIDIGNKTKEYNYNGKNQDVIMHINTSEILAKKQRWETPPYKNIEELKRTAAHEFAHCLGIDDAYDLKVNLQKTSRSYKTNETGWFKGLINDSYKNIMYLSHKSDHIEDNDLEMALQAQAEAYHGNDNSWQAFVDYNGEHNGYIYKCKQSTVIRQKKDK